MPRALVGPVRPKQLAFIAELLGRTGNNRIQIRTTDLAGKTAVFAVDRFRLFAADKPRDRARERIGEDALNALPWRGAGSDPLAAPAATAAPPWRVLP